jgi:hypothetical protein
VGKGAKIAIGCGIAAVLAVVLAVGGIVGLGYWGKRKLQSAGFDTQSFTKMAELQKKAQALPFTPPSDGVIAEERFVRFLEIRKAVFPLYEKHRAELDQQREKKQKTSFNDVMRFTGIVSEVRSARLEAMLAQGMGTAEYDWLTQTVYRTQIGARIAAATGARNASQAIADAMEKARRDVEAERQRSGQGTAEREHALDETQRQLQLAGQAAQAQAAAADVPAANLALFAKYKADIDRYAMPELALVGM